MNIQIAGFDGPVARKAKQILEQRGHKLVAANPEAAIFFPGSAEQLQAIATTPGLKRLVLRSHGFAYAADAGRRQRCGPG